MDYIPMLALGAIFLVLGCFNIKGNISSIHWYNRRKVLPEDVPAYGKAMGTGTVIMGAALMLTAILQISNALDRSHRQKCRDIRAVLKENQLVITVNTAEDITLEKGLFDSRADFFEEVYSLRPVIRQKRIG